MSQTRLRSRKRKSVSSKASLVSPPKRRKSSTHSPSNPKLCNELLKHRIKLPPEVRRSVKLDTPLSEHAKAVYIIAQIIPKSKVTTYGAIAALIKSTPRAVGQALRRNPYAPTVPCHRIVASKGGYGGFSGHTSGHHMDRKIGLLESEGVRVNKEAKKVELKDILTKEELLNVIDEFLASTEQQS